MTGRSLAEGNTRRIRRLVNPRNAGLVIALLGLLAVLSQRAPFYLTWDNLTVVGIQITSVGIVAVGTTYLLISGNVDLSVGSLFGLTSVLVAIVAKTLPVPVAFTIGIAGAAAIGLGNGLLVWRIRVSPIIVTLGSLTALRGIALLITHGVNVRDVPAGFASLGRAAPLGVPMALWVLLILMAGGHVILTRTAFGRHTYAVGGNRAASAMAGVNVRFLVLTTFAINGALVGIAGVLAASRFGTATPLFGTGLELDVLTAVILGGVAFSGGEGRLSGVFLAVIFVGVVNSGLVAMQVDAFYTEIVKGSILILAVGIEQLASERRERRQKAAAMEDAPPVRAAIGDDSNMAN